MMGVANILKDNNLQMQSNFQMLMKGIVNLSERVERESVCVCGVGGGGGSSITASSQTTNITHSSPHDLTQNTSSEGLPIIFLLLRYSVLLTVESLSLLQLLVIS